MRPDTDGLFPTYTMRERTADLWVHIVGLAFGVVASIALFSIAVLQGRGVLWLSLGLYAAGLIAMLGCSALYNLSGDGARKEKLRRLDHAAIFLMIAGSYSPFLLVKIGGAWGLSLFVVVWVLAAGGVALKLLYPRRFERLSIALYLMLGWIVLIMIEPLLNAVELPAVILLGVGGVLYSAGVLFHVWHRLPYHNAIWHLLVLAAAGCHFGAVLGYVALAGTGA